jgi:transcriptional regulator with XRE-family HTH domain
MTKQRTEFEDQLARMIGANCRRLFEERRTDTKEVADLLECSVRATQSYFKGERRFSIGKLVRIAYALGVSLDDLVTGPGPRPIKLRKLSISDIS